MNFRDLSFVFRASLYTFFILLISSLSILHSAFVHAQNTQNFRFESFSADYYLNRESDKTPTLKVVENLVAIFPNYDQNHGILRAIPNSYEDHSVSLEVESVMSDNGRPLKYTTYEENDNLVLKIGDADRYVQGRQVYVITYTMRNVTQFLGDHDEFYWDVNGDQWSQPFDMVSARIHVPEGLATYLQERQICFAGYLGSSKTDGCSISRAKEGDETIYSVNARTALLAGQTLSFALAFENDTFALGPEVAREKMVQKIKNAATAIGVMLPPIFVFGLMFRRWRAFGNDPSGRGVIVPEYQPPKELNVLRSSFIINQNVVPKTISASIIQMAIGKQIKINEIKEKKKLRRDTTDYELVLLKNAAETGEDTRGVLKAIFANGVKGDKVKISEITSSTTKRSDIIKQIGKLNETLADSLFKQGYFMKDPRKIRNHYMSWAAAPFFSGLLLLFISSGFIPLAGLGCGLMLAGVIMFFFAFYMPARTEQGVAVHDALLGLKEYIDLAEKDRLAFGQSPEGAEKIASGEFDPTNPKMQVKLFESLLPYAMLFGLEKQWGEKFKDIYKTPPDWYSGNMHTFNAAYLASSMHSFSTASSVSFAPASSSSSGGFSGGSAGGGGGGGGGGGW